MSGKDARHNQSASAGSFNIKLTDWNERKGAGHDINAVIREIYRKTARITSAQVRASQQPMISGYGTGSGFELYVQDRKGATTDELLDVTHAFIDALNKRPEISRAYTTFDTKYPQYIVQIRVLSRRRNAYIDLVVCVAFCSWLSCEESQGEIIICGHVLESGFNGYLKILILTRISKYTQNT